MANACLDIPEAGVRDLSIGTPNIRIKSDSWPLAEQPRIANAQHSFAIGYVIIPLGSRGFRIETDREVDGRWIAEVPDIPGALAYGSSLQEAVTEVQALAFRIVAERLLTPSGT
jgi:hypothetical protein